MILPHQFRHTIIDSFGDEGSAWLQRLPDLIAYCERRWSLVAGLHFNNLSYNYVAPAMLGDGTEIVLKLGVPRTEQLTEAAALRHYNGQGSVRLLDAEPGNGILLLERLKPGSMLATLWPDQDEEATRIAARIMRQLWQPVPPDHTFVTVQDWFKGFGRLRQEFDGGSGPFPAPLIDMAKRLYGELQASMGTPLLLHGDLHHFNILAAKSRLWLATDPKGIVGEAAYDTGALLRNPMPEVFDHPKLSRLLERRVAILAEMLDLTRKRISSWGMAQTVLSAWWFYEDHGSGWEPSLALAEKLAGPHLRIYT